MVGVKIGKMENRVKNDIFHYLVEERKQEIENMGENFPYGPTFFLIGRIRAFTAVKSKF